MTLDEKKEFVVVVSVVVIVSSIVLISLINKFNIYDFCYLIVCIIFLFRYTMLKLKK